MSDLVIPALFRQGFSSPSAYPVEVYNGSLAAGVSRRRFDMVGPGELAVWGGRRVKNVLTGSWVSTVTSGQTLTLAHNVAVGPDGQMTASRLTMARSTSGSVVYTWAGFQISGFPNGMPYVAALTMRTVDGSPQRVVVGGGINTMVVTVDGTWRRFACPAPLSIAGSLGTLYCRALLYDLAGLSCDLLVAMDPDNCPQIEIGTLIPGEPTYWSRDYGWGIPGVRWSGNVHPASLHATSKTVAYDPNPAAIPDVEGIRPMPPYTMAVTHTLHNIVAGGWTNANCSASIASVAGPITGMAPIHLVEVDPTTANIHRVAQAMGVPASSYAWAAAIVRASSRDAFQLQIYNAPDGNLAYATFRTTSRSITPLAGQSGMRELGDDWFLAWVSANSFATNGGSTFYLTIVNEGGGNIYTASPGLGYFVAWSGGGIGRLPIVLPTTGTAVSILADANLIPTSTPASLAWSSFIEFFVPSPGLAHVASSFFTTNPRLGAFDSGWHRSVGLLQPSYSEIFLQDDAVVALSSSNAAIVPNAVNRLAVVVDPPFTQLYANGRLVAQASFFIGSPFSRIGYASGHVFGGLAVRDFRTWRDFALPRSMAEFLTASRAA